MQANFLDEMVERCDDEPAEFLCGCLELLQSRSRLAMISTLVTFASVQRLEKLPKLQAGVTHEENGPFAEFLKEYLQDVDDDDDDDNNNNGVDEEEKPSPKKQRVQ